MGMGTGNPRIIKPGMGAGMGITKIPDPEPEPELLMYKYTLYKLYVY